MKSLQQCQASYVPDFLNELSLEDGGNRPTIVFLCPAYYGHDQYFFASAGQEASIAFLTGNGYAYDDNAGGYPKDGRIVYLEESAGSIVVHADWY